MLENQNNNEEKTENIETEPEPETSETLEIIVGDGLDAPRGGDVPQNPGEPPEQQTNENVPPKKSFKDSIAGTALILGMIGLITALLLSVLHSFASPVIAKRLADEKEAAVAGFFGDGTYASEIDLADYEDNPHYSAVITEILEVRDNDSDSLAGYCVTAKPKGFNGKINMLVAVTPDGKVKDTAVIEQNESGKGPNIRNEEFRDKFKNKTKGIKIEDVKIAGATVSSKAFMNGVNAALEIVGEIIAGR